VHAGGVDTAERYRRFADVEAKGTSPAYERTARSVAGDDRLLRRLDRLPVEKRQPNLLLAACRLLGAPTDVDGFLDFAHTRWPEVEAIMRDRSTQTNEPARCASLLPLLAALPPPLALVEAGASAGLCLYPDRYTYAYVPDDDPGAAAEVGGGSTVELRVATSGAVPVPVPAALPTVVWRAGVDLHPLDVRRDEDMAWLRACIWPEHDERRRRLAAAVAIARSDPPHLVAGDLVTAIPELLAEAPAAATTVVFHSAVLSYLWPEDRERFVAAMQARPDVVWISNEAARVVAGLTTDARPPDGVARAFLVVGVGGARVAAIADPHGAWLRWLEAPEALWAPAARAGRGGGGAARRAAAGPGR